MCHAQWPLTLAYIFKAIQSWLCNKIGKKFDTSCGAGSTTCTVLDGFFPYLAQMITSMRGCVACNDLWPWSISSRSFSHDFAIKLLKYGTSCAVRSTACTVLDEFFLYLAQMITNMRGYVVCNDLWPWPIFSRLFSCEVAYLMDYIHMWSKYNPGGMMCHVPFPGQ